MSHILSSRFRLDFIRDDKDEVISRLGGNTGLLSITPISLSAIHADKLIEFSFYATGEYESICQDMFKMKSIVCHEMSENVTTNYYVLDIAFLDINVIPTFDDLPIITARAFYEIKNNKG